jgi:hypothetical protein
LIQRRPDLGNSLSVSGGIGSFQKGNLRPQSQGLHYPHKVADRRKPAARMSQREFANQKALIAYAEQNSLAYLCANSLAILTP